MDLKKIKTIYEESLRMNPEPASEADKSAAKELVSSDEPFKRFLANLNIDELKNKRPNFADDDDIVGELDDIIWYIQHELNNKRRYKGQIIKVGSCIDDSKVHRVDEADTLYVFKNNVEIEPKMKDNSFAIKGVACPSKFVADFADCIESIMQKWRPTGALTHGGCLAPSFSGVRYNGPAVTALFVYEKEDQPLYLSLDVTPTFDVTKQFIPKELRSKIELLKEKQPDKIYDMTGIYLFPNIINDEWQLTTAHFEAKLFRDLPKRSPLKQAYNFVKIISHLMNKANEKCIFKKVLNSLSLSKNLEKEILQALEHQKAPETYKFMRYGHLFLTKEIAKCKNEIGKSTISINTSAMKHLLLTEAFRNPDLSGESSNIEDDVYKLVTKAFEVFLSVKSGEVPHALLRCNISIYSISKPSLMDGMGPLLQCVLMEECRAIYNKINLQDTSDVNTLDSGTCILAHLKWYVVPVSELVDPRYHYRVPLDASISPRRNPRVTHIYQIISACANSCGGTISIPVDNREMIDDETLARWKDHLSIEINKRFKHVSVSFGEQLCIGVEPSVHLVKVNIEGCTSYNIQPDGFVLMTPDRSRSDQQLSSHWSIGEDGVHVPASTSAPQSLQVPSTEQSTVDNSLHNTQDATTASGQPESQESSVVAEAQETTGSSEISTYLGPTSEDGPPIDQLKRTHLLTWTKTSDWEKHLTVPKKDFLLNYKLHSQTFERTSPLCIYPSLILLDERFHDQVNALAERYKGQKGFLLWSRHLMTMFDSGFEVPIPPEGHQLDVLCVRGQDTLTLDLCAFVDGNRFSGESYIAHAGRLLRFLMTHKLRENKWMTNKEVSCISIQTYVFTKMQMCPTETVQAKQSTSKDIVQKQLASLSLLLLDKTHHTEFHVKLQDLALFNLSYEQSRAVTSSRQYNFIEGPPGSGKSMVALYICKQHGKDQTAFLCTTPAYKAFMEHQDKATVYLVQDDEDLKTSSKSLEQYKCVIIDDVHNLPCSKKSVHRLLKKIQKYKIIVFLFADCKYQNYKHPKNDIFTWFRQFCVDKRIVENYQQLEEVHRNTRTIASFLSAGLRTEDGIGDKTLICAHTITGNDVVFRKTLNLFADNDENGILQYVKSLIRSNDESQCTYEPNQIAVLLDTDDSMIKTVTDVLSAYLPNVKVLSAEQFPRTGIIVDSLESFMGLESLVCIFPILNQNCKSTGTSKWFKTSKKKKVRHQHNIFELKYKMFVASRAVHHMAFLMEEDFDTRIFAEMRMDNIQSWVPDYRHTGRPRTFSMLGDREGEFVFPRCVAACSRTGRLVVTDWGNNKIRVVTGELRPVVTFGCPGERDGEFAGPWGVTVTPAGDVYITDWGHHRVQVHGLDGEFRHRFGSRGSESGQYDEPRGITHHGDRLYVCDYGNRRIIICDMKGRHITEIALPFGPEYIAVSKEGRQLAVSGGGVLQLMTTAGVVTRTLRPGQGDKLEGTGVCYDGYGHLIVADEGGNCLRVLREDGSRVCEITVPGERGRRYGLMGVNVTADGDILSCDEANHCIYLYKVPGLS